MTNKQKQKNEKKNTKQSREESSGMKNSLPAFTTTWIHQPLPSAQGFYTLFLLILMMNGNGEWE
jgi:hypothetical protein